LLLDSLKQLQVLQTSPVDQARLKLDEAVLNRGSDNHQTSEAIQEVLESLEEMDCPEAHEQKAIGYLWLAICAGERNIG